MHVFPIQVNVDNIDRDLFGRNVRGAMYQPVDETLDKYKNAAFDVVRAAYDANVVREPFFKLSARAGSSPACIGALNASLTE